MGFRISLWVQAIRPKTLTASLVPIFTASALSYYLGAFDPMLSLYALISTLCIQIAANFFNDAIDFKKGADTEERIGPQRITQSGLLNYKQVMLLGAVHLGLALLFALPIVYVGEMPIIVLGLVSMFFAYAYTGGPFPLAYLGIADLFVILFFGFVAVGGLAFVQLGFVDTSFFVLGLQVGLLCNLMLAINNLRDWETDRKVGKNTLAVRFGKNFVRAEICFLYMLPFLCNLYWFFRGMPFTALLNFVMFPFACLLCYRILQVQDAKKLNPYLAASSLYYLAFGVFHSIGIVLDRGAF